MDNILNLQKELETKYYKHGPYYAFKINDPKPRDIHKAKVRDRIVHHAIYKILYPFYIHILIKNLSTIHTHVETLRELIAR
jgi:hypothetical protein